jgi:hypothetical protein
MTLGHGLHGGRKKQGPSAARVVGWILGLAFIIAIGAWSYRTGSSLARQEEARLRAEVTSLTETMETVEERNTALNAALERAQTEKADAEARYARDVPDAETARIVELVRMRRADGVPADRIAEVVRAVTPQWRCTGDPVTRRFIIRTPLTTTPGNDVAGFANNTITVTGTGVSEVDANGRPQSWYDPNQPVTLTFNRIGGGQPQDITGRLPLFYSVVSGNQIVRFSAVPGDRAFINVTGQTCAYP